MADQLQLSTDPTVTVLIVAPCGRLIDLIPDASLGDRVEAFSRQQESLHTASLWGYLATVRHRQACPDCPDWPGPLPDG